MAISARRQPTVRLDLLSLPHPLEEGVYSVQAAEDTLAGRCADTSSQCRTDPRFLRPPTPGRTASTPARDLRLLFPIDLVLRFPDCVTTTPEAFAIPNDRPVTDVIARQSALAMAYNPNHCIEIRWGAPDGSP